MPGVIPLEDAQQYFTQQLQQHAQDAWSTVQQAVQPAVQAVQQLQVPQVPQVDPNEIIQRLQQHAQDTWSQAQQIADQAQATQQQAADEVERQRQAELERQRQAANTDQSALDKLDAAVQAARGVGDFVGQQQAFARDVRSQAHLPVDPLLEPMELGNLGRNVGVDPYQQIVEQGVPQIVRGAQQGDAGAIIGGAVQTLLGAASALPGAGGAARGGVGVEGLQRFLDGAPLHELTAQPAATAAEEATPGALGRVRDFLTGGDSEAGSVRPQVGLRLGGAAAGGVLGNLTTPEDADPFARGAHIAGGTLAGAAAPNLLLALRDARPTQAELDALRVAARQTVTGQGATEAFVRQRVLGQPATTGDVGTFAQDVVSGGKGNLLSSATTHLGNIATQLVELAQQPIGRAVTGGESEAVAGLRSAGLSVPEAVTRFKDTLKSGVSMYADPERGITRTYNPFLRLLAGTDDFFRTIGEGMGRGMEAQRVLAENGRPTDASAISGLIQSNRDRILGAGDQASRTSVFGGGTSSGIGRTISDFKNRMLSSPNTGAQATGMLVDALVPFAVVPDRIWTLGVLRAPGVSEINTLRKVLRLGPNAPRTDAEVRDALGTGLVNSVINMGILSQVANGNVTGPDDPEHPNSVRIGGTWVDYSNWGPLAAQFAIPAAIVESARKTNNLPDQGALEYAGHALNASTRAVMQLGFLDNLLNLVGSIGHGDTLGGLTRSATQYLDRVVPSSAMLNSIEQAFDANMRDVNAARPWERQMSRIPGVAGMLPEKISATTGEPELRPRQGPAGVVFRAQTQEPDPLRKELNRLQGMGYTKLSLPDSYPDTISYNGATIKLSPAEQRAVQQATGARLATFAKRLDTPAYKNLPNTDAGNNQRALAVQAWLNAAEGTRFGEWVKLVGRPSAVERLRAAQTVAGRLVNQSAAPQLPQINLQDVARRIDPNAELAPLYLAESYRRRLLEEAQRRADAEAELLRPSGSRELING